MKSKEIPVSTRILVSIIVMICVSISLVNLFTMFGVISSPDILTYAIMIGLYMVPFIIISATVNKIFKEEKKAIKNLVKGEMDISRKIEFNIKFKPKETIMADTSTHPAFYVKIAIASILSVSVGLVSFSLFSEGVLVGELNPMLIAFAPLFAVCALIHLFSKNIFGPHGWREFLEHTWIALLVIIFSISFMMSLRHYVLATYPRQFWESFMGLPFSLHTIMFFLIMLLIGGILIRLGDFFKLETSPLKASGTTFVLLSISFLVPIFDFIRWDTLLFIVSQAFSISLIVYGIAVAVLLYKDAGMRYLVTNGRVIKLNTHKLERSLYYPLVNLKKVNMVQDMLASTFGYGNIVLLFKVGKENHRSKAYCILYGVKKPELMENTIKAVSDLKKTKVLLDGKKRRPIKRKKVRPIKRRKVNKKIPVKKKKISSKKRDFHYRLFVPVFMISLLLTSMALPTISADNGTLPPQLVHEDYLITYSTASILYINGTFEVHAYTVEGRRMEVHEIKMFATESPENGEFIEYIIHDEIEAQVQTLLEAGYKIVEDTVGVNISTDISIDKNSLYDDTYSSDPIIAYSNISVSFESSYYGLRDYSDLEDIVMGTLKVGGYLSQDFEMVCKGGHMMTYNFVIMGDLVFGNGENELTTSIDNTDNTDIVRDDLLIEIHHSEPIDIGDIHAESSLLIDIYEIKRGEAGEYLTMNVNYSAMIYSISVPSLLEEFIPDQLKIEYVNADLLRLFNHKGLGSAVYNFIDFLEHKFTDQLHRWGDEVVHDDMSIVNLDADYDIDHMDSGKPILFFFNASLRYTISDRAEGMQAFIPTKFSFSDTVSLPITGTSDLPMDIKVLIPQGIDFMSARLDGANKEIHEDETGRQYTTLELEPGASHNLAITLGTTVNLMEMFPIVLLIIFLFITWFSLNVYSIKKRRRKKKSK